MTMIDFTGRAVEISSPHGQHLKGTIVAQTASDVVVNWISPNRPDEVRADFFERDTLIRSTDLDDDPRAVRLKCLPQRVLITGAEGFLGQTLARHLHAAGHTVIGFDRRSVGSPDIVLANQYLGDITDFNVVREIIDESRPDVIYHLAAVSHVKTCHEMAGLAFSVNVQGTQTLLEAVRTCQERTPRVVIAGSGEEYGAARTADSDSALVPYNIYGATKAAASMLAIGYANAYGLSLHIVRMANLYGPGQDESKFIPLVIGKLLRGETVELHGGGTVLRDWLYVDDACSALIRLGLGRQQSEMVFNLPGSEMANLVTVTDIIIDCLMAYGAPPPGAVASFAELVRLVGEPSLVGGVEMSGHFATVALDLPPNVQLETGIGETVSAFLANR